MGVDDNEYPGNNFMGSFDPRIFLGKRYDLDACGRRPAYATFYGVHQEYKRKALIWGMDLTILVQNPSLDYFDYVKSYTNRFADDVKDWVGRMKG